jgi:uncharacterized membrane protein
MNDTLRSIPWNVFGPLAAIELILIAAALISLVRAEQTRGPKWLWILVVLFIGLFGPVAYFLFGRRND